MTDELSRLEEEIGVLSLGNVVSDMEIAKRLARVQDANLWEGLGHRVFKSYLKGLAKRMWEKYQVKASEGNYERLLSHYRLFVEKLGFSEKDCLMVGMGNLDIVRTMIDWRSHQREIGPGGDGKMNETQAKEFFADLVAQAYAGGGALPVSVVRAAQEQQLGRVPITVKLVARVLDENRVKVTAIELWEGGTVHRAMESLSREKFHWLAKRLRAATEEVQF
jgi:hypothetical protein